MSMRAPNPSCDDGIQRKRTAPESTLDDRIYTSLESVGNTDCLSMHPVDAASEQGDTSLVPQKPSKDADSPDLNVGPLTEQALRQLNKSHRPYSSEASQLVTLGTDSEGSVNSWLSDEPKDAIDADHPSYSRVLKEKGICFADDDPDKDSSNIQELMKAVSAERPNYAAPDSTAARNLRIRTRKALNESAMVQSVLPDIVPLAELWRANDLHHSRSEMASHGYDTNRRTTTVKSAEA